MANIKIKILRDGNGNAVKIIKIRVDKQLQVCYNECVKRGTSAAKATKNRGN